MQQDKASLGKVMLGCLVINLNYSFISVHGYLLDPMAKTITRVPLLNKDHMEQLLGVTSSRQITLRVDLVCMASHVLCGPGFMLYNRAMFGKAIVFMSNMDLDMNLEDVNGIQWLTEAEVSSV